MLCTPSSRLSHRVRRFSYNFCDAHPVPVLILHPGEIYQLRGHDNNTLSGGETVAVNTLHFRRRHIKLALFPPRVHDDVGKKLG